MKKIIDDFSTFCSWEEKYEHLIDLGSNLTILDVIDKTDKNLLRGCQSKVWLTNTYKHGKVYFYADSDALITKGMIALIVQLYSGLRPREIINFDTDIFSTIGLDVNLSMNRLNGLNLMMQKVKQMALKYI